MARKLLLAYLVVAAGLGVVGSAAGQQRPILRSATVEHRHLVVRLAVSDLRPVELVAATRRAEDSSGALLRANVRFRETITLVPSAAGVVRWRTRKTLPPGIYFVQVMAVDSSGITDCPHWQPNCLQHWSNVRRVVAT